MRILFWLSIGLDRRATSEHLLTAIIEALYNEGHTVHILQKDTQGDRNELPSRLLELGVTTSRIKCPPSEHGNLIARYIKDIRYYLNGGKWLRKNRGFDKVFLQSTNLAGLQVRLLRKTYRDISITYNVQDIFPENAGYSGVLSSGSIPFRMMSAIQKYAYRHADKIITISEDMKTELIRIGAPAEHITVVYNWSYQDDPYDMKNLDYTRVAPLLTPGKFNVVYGGNIGRMQNVDIVVQTAIHMKEQEDVVFHIFGDGVYKEKLQQMARQANTSNIFFHPMLDSNDAPALYASADVNVIPLGKNIYRTALPSKTATCLACGKPMIFAIGKDSSFGQMMESKTNTQLIDADDVKSMCKAIVKIKEKGPGMKSEWKEAFCKHFSKTINSRLYANIITDE